MTLVLVVFEVHTVSMVGVLSDHLVSLSFAKSTIDKSFL